MMDTLNETHYFVTPVYMVRKEEFLESVKRVSNRYLSAVREKKKRYALMTGSYSHEPEIQGFAQYVSQTAWNILAAQGFDMKNLVTYFTEMWTQEHSHMSSMETHMHGRGAQVSAFYFLDTPKGGCKFAIHDPRPSKVIINLPEDEPEKMTMGSHQILFTPEPGTLIFTNAWLPHSMTKNHSREPVRFVHMNLSVAANPTPVDEPEII
jgi:uncharacterized protein (TIGR02466 family)